MVSTRPSILLLVATTSALATQSNVVAASCDADNYSKVTAAVQTLHINCASWTAYLASRGVWTFDSTCLDSVSSLIDTLPDCTFGGPYGQNNKDVVEGMAKTCGELSDSDDTTTSSGSLRTSSSGSSGQSITIAAVLGATALFLAGMLQV
ncbi:hypothetical protein ON010_g14406 [Phytophthora cinnamomi]|nr:hypothetical protein ON010_g14406 [Phytophthora cinnamomi]